MSFVKELVTQSVGNIHIGYKANQHLQAHKDVLHVLDEAASKIVLPNDGSFLATEVDLGRVIGISGCVKAPAISLDDEALFAQRIDRPGPSRIVLTKGQETSKVVLLAFKKNDEPNYMLVTAWIGTLSKKEPWDNNINSIDEYNESIKFWSNHALTYDKKVMTQYFTSTWEREIRVTKEKLK